MTGVLTLTGDGTPANYTELLNGVTYFNEYGVPCRMQEGMNDELDVSGKKTLVGNHMTHVC